MSKLQTGFKYIAIRCLQNLFKLYNI